MLGDHVKAAVGRTVEDVIVIVFVPCADPQALFEAVIVLVPAVDQETLTLLPVEEPLIVPPLVPQLQPVAEGVQFCAEAVNANCCPVWPEAGPVTPIDGVDDPNDRRCTPLGVTAKR